MAFKHHDADTLAVARDVPMIKQRSRRSPHPILSRWHMTASFQIADILVIIASLSLSVFVLREGTQAMGDGRWIGEACIAGLALCLALHIAGAYRYHLMRDPVLSITTAMFAWIGISIPILLLIAASAPAVKV